MPNIAILPGERINIPVLGAVVDGYPDAMHKVGAETVEEPLESGVDITDHAVTRPAELQLHGMVSNMRLANGAGPALAWEAIRRLNDRVQPVSVVTPWRVYTNMLITDAEATPFGRGMRFTMELRELRFVGNVPGTLLKERVLGYALGRTSLVDRGRIRTKVIDTAKDKLRARLGF